VIQQGVPHFSSVFPLDGETVLLPEDVEEARELGTKMWEAEPETAARTEPHPMLETPEAPVPGATSTAPDAPDPGGTASAPDTPES
jgi:hypothetical protein